MNKIRFSHSSFSDTNDRKNSLRNLQEFFQLYSPSASYIELRSVIFASQVIFASRVLEANIISLLRKQKYHCAYGAISLLKERAKARFLF